MGLLCADTLVTLFAVKLTRNKRCVEASSLGHLDQDLGSTDITPLQEVSVKQRLDHAVGAAALLGKTNDAVVSPPSPSVVGLGEDLLGNLERRHRLASLGSTKPDADEYS